jgi:hypothetical protein
MSSELRLLSALFTSFVVRRVTPLLLSHYEIISLLSTQVQCRDSKNVARKRSPVPVLVRAEPTVLIGSEIHLSPSPPPSPHAHLRLGCRG